jgi:hypothetical protein
MIVYLTAGPGAHKKQVSLNMNVFVSRSFGSIQNSLRPVHQARPSTSGDDGMVLTEGGGIYNPALETGAQDAFNVDGLIDPLISPCVV